MSLPNHLVYRVVGGHDLEHEEHLLAGEVHGDAIIEEVVVPVPPRLYELRCVDRESIGYGLLVGGPGRGWW